MCAAPGRTLWPTVLSPIDRRPSRPDRRIVVRSLATPPWNRSTGFRLGRSRGGRRPPAVRFLTVSGQDPGAADKVNNALIAREHLTVLSARTRTAGMELTRRQGGGCEARPSERPRFLLIARV